MSLIMRYIAKFKMLFFGNNKKKNKKNLALLNNNHEPKLEINDDGSIHYFGVNDANPIKDEHVNYRKKDDDTDVVVMTALAGMYTHGNDNKVIGSNNSGSISSTDYEDSNKIIGSSNSGIVSSSSQTDYCSTSSSTHSNHSGGYGSYGDSSSSSSSSSDGGGGGGCD